MSRQKILLFLLASMIFSGVRAADLPFTDVAKKEVWYGDLKHMYEAGVIQDTADHLFRPDGLLSREEFVSITVGVSCYKCLYPSPDDIIRYTKTPFVDIGKSNNYFYCISYAKEKGIVLGYTPDGGEQVQCQNKESFPEVAFCPANNITRIEAAAVLLRQAGLWDEVRNSGPYEKTITFSDVDDYWYGYAQKAVQLGLLSVRDNKVLPNEYIMRKEFVQMASKIFSINMCSIKNSNTPPSDSGDAPGLDPSGDTQFSAILHVCDKSKTSCNASDITPLVPGNASVYDFWGYTAEPISGLRYDWTFTNIESGKALQASGAYLDNFDLTTAGTWIVKLVITDEAWKSSQAYQQISVTEDAGSGTGTTGTGTSASSNGSGGLSLQIGTMVGANGTNSGSTDGGAPSSGTSGNGGSTNVNTGDFGVSAGALTGLIGVPMNFFSTPSGGDGIYSYHWEFSDNGISSVQNPSHTFMQAGTYPVTLVSRDASGNVAFASLVVTILDNPDRDGDGVRDYSPVWSGGTSSSSVLDVCPLVQGPPSNKGCPVVLEFSDTIVTQDGGASTISSNLCVTNKAAQFWSIEGKLQCTSCPCIYSSEFNAQIRGCDIIFPSITSPDKKTLYSRGAIFQLP